MTTILDQFELGIPCDKCGNVTKKPIGWVKNNRDFTCSCGAVITLDSSQLAAKIAEIDRQLSNFNETKK